MSIHADKYVEKKNSVVRKKFAYIINNNYFCINNKYKKEIMAFLRIEKKSTGHYLRIVEGQRVRGKVNQKTLYSLGKVEDYSPNQLRRIGEKLLKLSGYRLEEIIGQELIEEGRYNYGYAVVIKKLWKIFRLEEWYKRADKRHRNKFNWLQALELMISERLNEPCSKRSSYFHQTDYIGFGEQEIELHHLYRTLDILSEEQESLKRHLLRTRHSLFSEKLDVVFYDVTTLYFDSTVEEEGKLRQKGYSKDGKAHKTQIVLGLLVDKLRNPLSYQIYKGNTYEGGTMTEALKDLQNKYKIDKVIVVADSAMIDKKNRDFIDSSPSLSYILGDRIKNLPDDISTYLLDKSQHKPLNRTQHGISYSSIEYSGRKIICTYSEERAKKDRFEREKLLEKANRLLQNQSQLRQIRKRGAGRYIQEEEGKYQLDTKKIESDAKWDGYKAIATTSELPAGEILSKYSDLFEVEHAFRTLKSQLEIRPMFHWTDKRIEGHITMCFLAYTFLNYLRNTTGLQQNEIVRTIDRMQLSKVKEKSHDNRIYIRSTIDDNQKTIIKKLNLDIPNDASSQSIINQYFN